MPEISIIVPVYGVEKYLETCIESLIKQTFENIEIILVDDGSLDNCGSICDRFALIDHRITVIHQKNGGLSCARNTGFRMAKGQYICFIDSDDYVAPNFCKKLHDMIYGTNYDYSVCGTCRFEDGDIPNPLNNAISGEFTNIDFLEKQLLRESEFGVWNKLYRRKSIKNMQFALGKIHEDVIWSADLAKNCSNGVICTEQQLYYYRQNNNGIVKQGAKKCSPDRVYAGEYLLETIRVKMPNRLREALEYAIQYPWMFVDSIYVHRKFEENQVFLNVIQENLRKYLNEYIDHKIFSQILLDRMKLFAKNKRLYAINVYIRLLRVYVYRLFHLDAYKDGHGV